MWYNSLLKPLLFRLPPEQAHHLTVKMLQIATTIPGLSSVLRQAWQPPAHATLRRQCFGLDFPNPLGLAAGFDKDGRYFEAMSKLGFGFIEIGTVTPRPQAGNPQPRLFRLPADEALINRMGFNNEGVDAMVERLKQRRPANLIIGGNIGKNKDTPNERAVEDYLICFDKLFPYVDYFVVNVSSPNTPNLRALQEKEPLQALLQALQTRNRAQAQPKPILLKIAPDLTDGQLDDILEIVQATQLAGLIATNTTIGRSGLQTAEAQLEAIGNGGLSGAPLRKRATEVIHYLANKSDGQLPIIGVGGIDSPAAALEKLAAGACLVQIYTGLVYRGPALIKNICEAIMAEQRVAKR
ncbi:MAG: quinone-dependent dihydroorotate dehydrogenase [Bacteroidetes bacterium]|nr:MAG: quinone-dependent dihydroorotate dehydrogenase [Bacteroidota bacterium]